MRFQADRRVSAVDVLRDILSSASGHVGDRNAEITDSVQRVDCRSEIVVSLSSLRTSREDRRSVGSRREEPTVQRRHALIHNG